MWGKGQAKISKEHALILGEIASSLQAVWEARTTGSSCPGNCFLDFDWKQPIKLTKKKRTARQAPVLHYNRTPKPS